MVELARLAARHRKWRLDAARNRRRRQRAARLYGWLVAHEAWPIEKSIVWSLGGAASLHRVGGVGGGRPAVLTQTVPLFWPSAVSLFICWQAAQCPASECSHFSYCYGQWRTEGGLGCSNLPPPKFWRPSKIVPNSIRLWKLLKIAEFRTSTPQDVRKKRQ